MLNVENVVYRLPNFLLGPVSLEVPKGVCHVLLGPSGAGKSSLLEVIVGFRSPESGRIFVEDAEVSLEPVHRRRIGYLPQRPTLFPHLTVRRNVEYGLKDPHKKEPWLKELLETLQIDELLGRRPESLSGGEAQRVALARAVASEPLVLVLDEPFGALNESLRRELWSLVEQLCSGQRLPVLMVTHDLDEAFALGDRVSILIDGAIHQSGPRHEVFHRPSTWEVARFLGTRNLFRAVAAASRSGDGVVYVPDLATDLAIGDTGAENLFRSSGADIWLGISEDFIHLVPYVPSRVDSKNVLPGRVEAVVPRGSACLVEFRPRNASSRLLVRLSPREFASLPSEPLAARLEPQHLFLIPGPGRTRPAGRGHPAKVAE